MKSKGNVRKQGFINRLFKESLILSCLGIISSRLISFFKQSVLSYIFSGCEQSDKALEKSGISRVLKKHKVKNRFVRTVKTKFALSIENSYITQKYRKLINRAIYTPVSTYGAFFATLGIYICLVYFVRHYGFGEESVGDIESLITGGVIILASIPLLLCRKALIMVLFQSVFVRNMLSDVIKLEVYDGERQHGAAGTALIIGSVLGVLSFFCGEVKILMLIAAVVYLLVVLHSPEMGLMSVIAAFPFCGRGLLCTAITVTLISYIIKVLRGKRNLRLNTASLFVLLLGLCFMFESFVAGGGNAWFAFCMTALYLLAANLISTGSLLIKCANSLTTGLGISIAVYAVQVFVAALNGTGWLDALVNSHSVFDSSIQFSFYLLLIMPFVFCKSDRTVTVSVVANYLLVVACIIYSVMNGNTVCAILAAVAATLFLAVQGRRVFRPFALCFGVPVGVLYFASVPISVGGMGFYTTLSGWLGAFKAGLSNLLLGAGMTSQSSALGFGGDSHSMYLQTFVECGALGLLLLVLAIAFAFQRVYAKLTAVGTANRNLTAAAGASCVVGLLIAMGTNLWVNADICFIFWLCLGLAGAAYEIRKEKRRGTDDEY